MAVPGIGRILSRLTGLYTNFLDTTGNSALTLVTARLKYVAESEWGLRRQLDVTLLEGQPYRTTGL